MEPDRENLSNRMAQGNSVRSNDRRRAALGQGSIHATTGRVMRHRGPTAIATVPSDWVGNSLLPMTGSAGCFGFRPFFGGLVRAAPPSRQFSRATRRGKFREISCAGCAAPPLSFRPRSGPSSSFPGPDTGDDGEADEKPTGQSPCCRSSAGRRSGKNGIQACLIDPRGPDAVGLFRRQRHHGQMADTYGIDIAIMQINDCVERNHQKTAGPFDGVSATNIDALSIPAGGGVDTSAPTVGDYSNGHDAIIVDGEGDLASHAGQSVSLKKLSVSHHLPARCLDSVGLSKYRGVAQIRGQSSA